MEGETANYESVDQIDKFGESSGQTWLLVDSGAHVSACTREFAQHVFCVVMTSGMKLRSVTGEALKTSGQIRVMLDLGAEDGARI